MVRAREGVEFCELRRVGVELEAHRAGDEGIVLAVDEHDRHLGLAHSLKRARALEIEAAEDARRDGRHDARDEGRDVHVLPRFLDDLQRLRERAVGDDALDAVRQRQRGRHEHRGRAHGHADEEHFRLGKTIVEVEHPREAVLALVDAEGDRMPLAGAVGALLDEEHVIAELGQHAAAAGEVARGRAAVAMEADGERSAVALVVIPAAQAQTVVRGDLDLLIRYGIELVDHAVDVLRLLLHAGGDRNGMVVVLRFVRGIEDETIRPVGGGEEQHDQDSEDDEKGGHCNTPFQISEE